jgi:hypothetical protein
MNNSDKPAMPCTFQTPEDDLLTGGGADIPEWTASSGLTKREHFAGLVIVPSEVLCKALEVQNPQGFTPDQYIEAAVMYKIREVDALLKELDK